jgi:hypothetical protein
MIADADSVAGAGVSFAICYSSSIWRTPLRVVLVLLQIAYYH